MAWVAGIIGMGVVGAVVLWWLLVQTEGVYLGRRVVVWLYDVYASRYDAIKGFDSLSEDRFLARPILERLPKNRRAPLVLDVATGTGRLPLALLEQPTFQGRVIALDLSRKMLAVAAGKLAPFDGRVSLLHQPAESLPFPDGTFDLVTCLEALEFMTNPRAVLRELARVLRPGGLLVLTNRQGIDARLMPGHTFKHHDLEHLLRSDLGLIQVQFQRWQVDYRLVWATKPGQRRPAGPLSLAEVWRCPRCGSVTMEPGDREWRCRTCAVVVPVGADGVIGAE
jgi:SAM-dependent methyltransferase